MPGAKPERAASRRYDGSRSCSRPMEGTALNHAEDAVFEAMLEGWAHLQHAGRRLQQDIIDDRCQTVRSFSEFTAEYPWDWTAGQFGEWMAYLAAQPDMAPISIRVTQGALRMFCDYITAPRYGWPEVCQDRFGRRPAQVCREWNTVAYLAGRDAPGHRPLTQAEVQRLLDSADARVEEKARMGLRGLSAAYQAATVLKVMYAWGLRRVEAASLDVADFCRYAAAPELGRFGALHVRCFRSSGYYAGTRRTVLSVMPWAADAVEDYVDIIRPRCRYARQHGRIALWPSKMGDRITAWTIEGWFAQCRDAAGLDPACTTRVLRDSYAAHLVEAGADLGFVQQQLSRGYSSASPAGTSEITVDFMDAETRKLLDQAIICSYGDKGRDMTANLDYRWRLREVMAARGMYYSAAELRPLLAERGLDLSYRQVYWLVTAKPKQLSLKVLVALTDIFGCTMEQLIEPVTPANGDVRHLATASGPDLGERITGVGGFRPRRARIAE